jgi:adenosylcobinamide-phosphate synthase
MTDALRLAAEFSLAVPIALTVDWLLGEPRPRYHPVVWMGRYLKVAGQRIAPNVDANGVVLAPRPWRRFLLGALAWIVGAVFVFVIAGLLQSFVMTLHSILAVAVLALLLKPLLAWRMLRDEVRAVEDALAVSLEAGRERLSWLVSRDVQTLDAAAVRESAIETLAENLNDSVIAPLFWFVLFGLPGAALYRYANTADAMWGYKGEREGRDWTWAGKWAARADDVLSWLPARITALLLLIVARRSPRGLLTEATRTPSPNSGWPMAAMALALNVRLSKPGVYALHGQAPAPQTEHTLRAVRFAARAVFLGAALLSFWVAAARWGGAGV